MSRASVAAESEWIDVTVPLRDGMVHWPGDPDVEVRRTLSIARGDGVNVTRIAGCAHLGTHVDAPLHFIEGASAVDALPLEACIGPARVLHLAASSVIDVDELVAQDIRAGERILLRTRNSSAAWHAAAFDEDFVALSPAAATWLAAQRIRALGIDYLSVSRYRDDAAAVHVPLLAAGILLIEGLDLAQAPAGPVDLICLPLRLAGADGAPARVVLRPRQRHLS